MRLPRILENAPCETSAFFHADFRYGTGFAPAGTAAADLDGDRISELLVACAQSDVVSVLGAPAPQPGDINGDGEIDTTDLLLSLWG